MKDFKTKSYIDGTSKPSALEVLEVFFTIISTENQIKVAHISIYAALLKLWGAQNSQNPFKITRAQVMHLAKISSKTTYHKCIKDLQETGHIYYNPSYHPNGHTEISILKLTVLR